MIPDIYSSDDSNMLRKLPSRKKVSRYVASLTGHKSVILGNHPALGQQLT